MSNYIEMRDMIQRAKARKRARDKVQRRKRALLIAALERHARENATRVVTLATRANDEFASRASRVAFE